MFTERSIRFMPTRLARIHLCVLICQSARVACADSGFKFFEEVHCSFRDKHMIDSPAKNERKERDKRTVKLVAWRTQLQAFVCLYVCISKLMVINISTTT